MRRAKKEVVKEKGNRYTNTLPCTNELRENALEKSVRQARRHEAQEASASL